MLLLRSQSNANNNTLNLNMSNYHAGMLISENATVLAQRERHNNIPTFQSSVETIAGLTQGLEEQRGSSQTMAGQRGADEAALSNPYHQYVAQYDLPRQQSQTQTCTNYDEMMQNFEDTLDDQDQDKRWVPASELDLLQSCQKIIDAALSMKCIQCHKIFRTTDFYDHIIVQRECIIETEGNMDMSDALDQPSQLLQIE